MNSILRFGVAMAMALTTTGIAHAADMRAINKAPPRPVAFSWSGCYVGGQLGGQWSRWTGDVRYPGDATHLGITALHDFNGDASFLYGGQIGCNWQPLGSSFVLGLEGDIVGADRGEVGGEIFRYPAPFDSDHLNVTSGYNTQGSLRVRAGYAVDRTLLYIAGGASRASHSATFGFLRDGDGALTLSTHTVRNGWNVGFGSEYAFVNNWTIGVEYRYTNYGSADYVIPAGTAGTLTWAAFTGSTDNLRTQDVRFRLNYLFNPGSVQVR